MRVIASRKQKTIDKAKNAIEKLKDEPLTEYNREILTSIESAVTIGDLLNIIHYNEIKLNDDEYKKLENFITLKNNIQECTKILESKQIQPTTEEQSIKKEIQLNTEHNEFAQQLTDLKTQQTLSSPPDAFEIFSELRESYNINRNNENAFATEAHKYSQYTTTSDGELFKVFQKLDKKGLLKKIGNINDLQNTSGGEFWGAFKNWIKNIFRKEVNKTISTKASKKILGNFTQGVVSKRNQEQNKHLC